MSFNFRNWRRQLAFFKRCQHWCPSTRFWCSHLSWQFIRSLARLPRRLNQSEAGNSKLPRYVKARRGLVHRPPQLWCYSWYRQSPSAKLVLQCKLLNSKCTVVFFSHYLAFPANKVTPLTQIIWANEVYLTIIYWAFVEAFSNPKPHSSNNKKMSQVILPTW